MVQLEDGDNLRIRGKMQEVEQFGALVEVVTLA